MTSTNKNSIPDTQCLKIKYIFICSMKKQMMFYNSKLRKTEKQRKSAFPNLGRTKNGRKRPSQHWENWKTAKNDFPNIGKIKKRHRLHFPPLGKPKNAEIAKNSVSLVSDERKTLKTAFRLQAKRRNCQKQRFACKRRAKNIENSISLISETQKTQKNARHPWMKPRKRRKYHFSRGGKSKTGKFCVSAAADGWKTVKTAFRPWPKCKKWEKLTFGHGRRTKNEKSWLSATAENLSSINFNAWQCILPQQKLNEMTVPGRDLTLGTPNFVFYRRLK